VSGLPGMKLNFASRAVLLIIISLLAVLIRIPFLDHISRDAKHFLLPWWDYISTHGGYRALSDPFSNYAPSYLYMMVLGGYLRPSWYSGLLTIKSISIFHDFFAAAVMYFIVNRRYRFQIQPVLAYAAVLFAPTVIANGSYWGQSDVTYTAWVLLMLYLLLERRHVLAVLAFSIGLSIKLQAIFIAPPLALLVLRRKIPWYAAFFPPLIYVLSCVPAILIGRDVVEVLSVYFNQYERYGSLSMNAPNLYAFWPVYYDLRWNQYALLLAGFFAAAIISAGWLTKVEFDENVLLTLALLSSALMPFFLPRMHERYFFLADLVSIAFAFYRPKLWFVPLLFQAVSFLAYVPYFFAYYPYKMNFLYAASIINTIFLAFLLFDAFRLLFRSPKRAAARA